MGRSVDVGTPSTLGKVMSNSKRIKLAMACSAGILGAVIWYGYDRVNTHLRHVHIAEKGGIVMPFNLDETTHLFQKTGNGGLQRVTAGNSSDTAQINLIRAHLRDESQNFRRGDFSSPAQIHGHAMPGLSELIEKHNQIDIRYTALSDGGQILYTTGNPALIDAIHRWFDAQLSDHGEHAIPR